MLRTAGDFLRPTDYSSVFILSVIEEKSTTESSKHNVRFSALLSNQRGYFDVL